MKMECEICGKTAKGIWSLKGKAKWTLCEGCFDLIFKDVPSKKLNGGMINEHNKCGRQK